MRSRGRFPSLPLGISLAVAVFLCGTVQVVVAAIEPDFLIDSDPKLQIPEPVPNFNPALKALWLEALQRPEIDLQRMAAETIARGHKHGIPALIEAVPRLEEIVLAEASHPAARFAAARALIVLESRGSGEKLFQASQTFGADLRQLVEPALALWDVRSARLEWIKRLEDPETRTRDLLLALRGLGQVREPSVLPRCLSLAHDLLRDPVVRLEAATTAGQLAETGLEQDAHRLAQGTRTPQFINLLCAIRLLARHADSGTQQLLIEWAGHAEPAVAAAALHRLHEIDSALVVPGAESALKNPDQRVRWEGAKAYLRLPTVERIPPLGQLLADAHPDVRGEVCAGLVRLSQQPDLIEPIQQAALQILHGDRWQGHEQAALLLGALEYKPAANRLVELLESPRTEVLVTAAWALRKLAVAETAPALIDKARRQTERRLKETVRGLDDQVVHLFEALGVLKATEAAPLLMQYVPKKPIMGARSRSAAIWALGRLMAGTPDPQVVEALSDRITDFADQPQESPLVKQLSAVSLARMNAVEEAPMMKSLVKTVPLPTRLGAALRWAVQELTGEALPPETLTIDQGRWFLEPFP